MQRHLTPTLSLLLAACGAIPAAELGGLEFHGFFSQGYVKSSHNEYLVDRSQHGSFDLNEAALNASWQATDRLRLFTQLYAKNMWSGEHDLVDEGTYSNARAPTVTLDLGYAQYTARDWLGVRLGRIKQAYGLYNEVRDLDVARSSATLPQSVYDDRDREQNFAVDGGGLFGSIDLGKGGALDYQAFLGKVEIPTDGRIFGQYATPDVGLLSTDLDFIFGGSLFWTTPVDGLRVGISYREVKGQVFNAEIRDPGFAPILNTTDLTVDLPERSSWVISGEYLLDNWTFQAEYQRTHQIQAYAPSTYYLNFFPFSPVVSLSPDVIDTEGYYLLSTYRIGKVEVGGYASFWSSDWNDRMGDGGNDPKQWQHDYAALLRYDVTDWWTLKLEGHFVDGTGLLDVPNHQQGYLTNRANTAAEHWYYAVARTTFNF